MPDTINNSCVAVPVDRERKIFSSFSFLNVSSDDEDRLCTVAAIEISRSVNERDEKL